jgi:hypothetical protein
LTDSFTDVLRAAWTALAIHPPRLREYRSQPLGSRVPLDVYAALRAADNAPCLLIRSQASVEALFEVGGMRLTVDRDERGPFLVLVLEDSVRSDLFTTVCADAITAAGTEVDGALDRFLARIDAWRRFLRDRHAGLSRKDTIGLIGELVVLETILSRRADFLTAWKAPEDGLHDFEARGHALEIKTGLGAASYFTISSLEQLDTSGLRRLDIIHVRLVEDPEGRTLGDLVQSVDGMLDDQSRRSFANQVLRRGLMPDDEVARSRPRVRVRSLDAYLVQPAFPKLLLTSVPAGIVSASYAIELRAISNHATDIETSLSVFAGVTPE